MLPVFRYAAFASALCFFIGCGDSGAPELAVEQDELAAYASENPAPPETDVDDAGGD
jgi:hypothetical protein